MLKAFFSIFEATEIQLTHKSVRRLRYASVMSLLLWPTTLIYMVYHPQLGKSALALCFVLIVVGIFALSYVCFARQTNRLFIPSKYLDESEILLKQRTSVLAAKTLIVLFMFLFGLSRVFPNSLDVYFANITPFAAIGEMMIYFVFLALSLMSFYASFLMRSIDDETPAILTSRDKIYRRFVIVFVLLFIFIPLIGYPMVLGAIDGYAGAPKRF